MVMVVSAVLVVVAVMVVKVWTKRVMVDQVATVARVLKVVVAPVEVAALVLALFIVVQCQQLMV